MLSSGANVIIWDEMPSSGANVIICIYCYHLVLSCDVIIWDDNTHLFIFPGNFTHSISPRDKGSFLKWKLCMNLIRLSVIKSCQQGLSTLPQYFIPNGILVSFDACNSYQIVGPVN
jgi:hypothetical protein